MTTGTGKVTDRMPYAFKVVVPRASVNTAPVGSTLIIDIMKNGTTIMTTDKLSIDAAEKTSTTAATPAALTTTDFADDDEVRFDITQVGSGVAGAGAKVRLYGYRTA